MTKDFSEQILGYLARQNYQPKKIRQLARALGIAEGDYNTFRGTVDRLQQTGQVVMGSKNAVMLPQMGDKFVGTYRANARGFGFVVPANPDAHEDLFIPEGANKDAITGDMVACEVRKVKRGSKTMTRGKVVQIIARGHSRFVGTLIKVEDRHFVEPDGRQFTDMIVGGDVGAKNARVDDKVVVELTQYPGKNKLAEGVIVEVLGERGTPGVDTVSVLRQFHIPDKFDDATLDEAGRIARGYDGDRAAEGRTDLRDEFTLTIDPASARDFDDAITLQPTDDGGWRLGVHIADVSAFVTPGTAMDETARERGNSVYFPNLVIPMLPEVLSNGVCSLQEGQDRLTKSVYITYDKRAKVINEEYYEAVIRSNKRLTYEQAQSVLDGNPDAGLGQDVVDQVRRMNKLARTIFDRRYEQGMLHLDLPDVELDLDDDGRVVDAHPEDTSFSHTIIEMFMVEANEAVARLLDRIDVPFLRRVHPDPEEDENAQLASFVKICGHKLPRVLDRKAMQKLLRTVEGKPEGYAINMALLRSFQRAEYSPKNEGHFALASRHYCHFTSPIRRYPDLHIHRLLEQHLRGELDKKQAGKLRAEGFEAKVKELGRHCSVTERRAESAERELKSVKVLELLTEHVGDHVYGVVNGVTSIGVFVMCSKYLVDGLIKFNDLTDDWWELMPRAGAVVGQRSGKRIQIGDLVEAQILDVDVARRELNLRLIADLGRKAKITELLKDKPTDKPQSDPAQQAKSNSGGRGKDGGKKGKGGGKDATPNNRGGKRKGKSGKRKGKRN